MSKKTRKLRKYHPTPTTPPPIAAEVLPRVDLGFFSAATIKTREWSAVHLVQVGAGGTGSYLAQHVGRIQRELHAQSIPTHWTIVDPDVIEEKNIGRQLFCRAELGVPKADALMRRYGQAWGLNVSSYVGRFDDSILMGTDLVVLIGCVDNAAARRELHDTLEQNDEMHDGWPRVWWLDCGNLRDTGRVLLGTAADPAGVQGCFPDAKQCYALPGPGLQFPDLLEDRPEDLPEPEMSCAEMAAVNLQSLSINARIAAEASDFLTRLLVTRDLKRFRCDINLAAGSAKSYYATPEEVSRTINQTVAYVQGNRPQAAVAAAGPMGAAELWG